MLLITLWKKNFIYNWSMIHKNQRELQACPPTAERPNLPWLKQDQGFMAAPERKQLNSAICGALAPSKEIDFVE